MDRNLEPALRNRLRSLREQNGAVADELKSLVINYLELIENRATFSRRTEAAQKIAQCLRLAIKLVPGMAEVLPAEDKKIAGWLARIYLKTPEI